MVTPASFKERLPEFTSKSDGLVQQYIDESAIWFDATIWGDFLDIGVTFWVAHYIFIDQDNAQQPQMDDSIMKKVGDIAKSRSDKLVYEQAFNDFLRSKYGTRYLMYKDLVAPTVVAV